MQHVTATIRPADKPQRASLAVRVLHRLMVLDCRYREARSLQRLSDDTLRDIGAVRDGAGRIVRR